MYKIINFIWASLLFFMLIPAVSHAAIGQNQQSWQQWVAELRAEAIADGISPQLFDDAFRGIQPDRQTLRFDRKQPEKRITFAKYRKTRGDDYRINLGKRKYKKYHALIDEVGTTYGVDPCVITSIWGIESSYGHYMGNFPVIKSLATLAYDPRRSEFFRKELILALHILQDGHVSAKDFKGEWAGGSGQSQFLPSSWHRFAVDYNNDGHKDIWKTHADVFASIANYLVGNGWQAGQSWGSEVTLPYGFDESLYGFDTKKSVAEWEQLGVTPVTPNYLPGDAQASVLYPYGGPPLLVLNNFRVLMRYNNSTFYAGTVAYMADKICKRY